MNLGMENALATMARMADEMQKGVERGCAAVGHEPAGCYSSSNGGEWKQRCRWCGQECPVDAATVAEFDAPGECETCAGCGQIANSEDGEPWTFWQELPVESQLAVTLGVVRPIPCPACGGSGVASDG